MGRFSISFFAINFILLFVGVSFVLAVFELGRLAFVLELGVLLVLIAATAFAVFSVYHGKKWGWTLIGANLVVVLANILFIYVIKGLFETAHITAVLFSMAGIITAFLNLRGEKQIAPVHNKKAEDYYPYIDKMEPEAAKEPSIEKTFTPGKFVASKKANKFHAAKCDWAKKIGIENQIWFNSREEAEGKGFEADKCIS